MKMYKIRNKNTGLFSRGGSEPEFNKKGKIWKTMGHLKAHLNQFITYGGKNDSPFIEAKVKNWEVIELEVVESSNILGDAILILEDKLKEATKEVQKEKEKSIKLKELKKNALSKLSKAEKEALNVDRDDYDAFR